MFSLISQLRTLSSPRWSDFTNKINDAQDIFIKKIYSVYNCVDWPSLADCRLGVGRGNRRRSGSSAKDDRKGNAWVDRRARRGTGRDAWKVCEQAKVSEGESMGCGSPPRRPMEKSTALGRVTLWNRDSAGIKQSQQLKNTYLDSQEQNLNSTYKGCVGKKARKCRIN